MTRPLLAAASLLALPLLLTGCSGGSSAAEKPSPTPTVSATPDPNFYITNGYVVTEPSSVSRKDLNNQLPEFLKLPGVKAAGIAGEHKIRVDVQFAITRPQRDAVIAKMRTYGTVAGVPIMPNG